MTECGQLALPDAKAYCCPTTNWAQLRKETGFTLSTATQTASTDIPARDRASEWGWALYQGGHNPYVVLVNVFLFGPFFAAYVFDNATTGQAALGYLEGFAGLIVALTAPILGASTDHIGRRKPALISISLLAVGLTTLLWFAMPYGSETGLHPLGVAFLLWALAILYEYMGVLHNSMLPNLTPPQHLGMVSGLGAACGNFVSFALLLGTILLISLPASGIGSAVLPDSPILGIDPEAYEDFRISGPLAGIVLLFALIPLALRTRDSEPTGAPLTNIVKNSAKSVWDSIRQVRHYKNVAIFLVARTLLNDGKVVILVFSGVYAAGIFKWGALDLAVYGVVLTAFGVVGGLMCGWLDKVLGRKKSLILFVLGTSSGFIVALSVGPDQILFQPYQSEWRAWEFGLMNTLPELIYILIGIVLAICITAAYASTRTFMAYLTPRHKAAEFFGLYAVSGTATAFIGHAMVGFVTDITDSQRWGLSTAFVLLVSGLIVLFWVREEPAE